MCRFTLYIGPPVRLATLLTEPAHSLIRQSYESEERSEPLNGDGFGIGWYAPRLLLEPAVFHEITPAWNSRNLNSIAKVVASPCILAHVRAATPGTGVNLANCHPFEYDRYLLMHNGHVGAFPRIRRKLLEGLTDEAFGLVRGSTDTEHLFAVFVDEIVRHGCPVDIGPPGAGGGNGAALQFASYLSSALTRTLALVRALEDPEPSFLNVAVADGRHAAVCRFANDPDEAPETLYYLCGEIYEPAGRRFTDRRTDEEGIPVVVSSERLTDDPRWTTVPPNCMVVLDRFAPPRLLPMDGDGRITA
jgi:predicted glutamine amidotransferase